MHACLLDMLHHACDDDIPPVAERIDVYFGRVTQIAVHQHRARAGDLHSHPDIAVERRPVVDDFHCPPAEHIGGPEQHRIADTLRNRRRFSGGGRNAVFGLGEP